MRKNLRAHHLLCIPLYTGMGYSGEFNRNMRRMIEELNMEDTKVKIVIEPDVICSACPNLTAQGVCRGDDNRVVQKDAYLVEALKIPMEDEYNFLDLLRLVRGNMNEEIFEKACGNCRWKRTGVCSYDKWVSRGG